MFAMLNFRIVAALVAAQVFLVTVIWPGASPLLGPALGAVAGAVIYSVGRALLRRVEPPPPAAAGADRLLLLSSASAFAAVTAFFFVLKGAGGGAPWVSVLVLAAALVALVLSSLGLNRVTAGRSGEASGS